MWRIGYNAIGEALAPIFRLPGTEVLAVYTAMLRCDLNCVAGSLAGAALFCGIVPPYMSSF